MTDQPPGDVVAELERQIRGCYPTINARADRIMALTGVSAQARWFSCPDPFGRPRVNAIFIAIGRDVSLLETDISNKRVAASITTQAANAIALVKNLNRTTEH